MKMYCIGLLWQVKSVMLLMRVCVALFAIQPCYNRTIIFVTRFQCRRDKACVFQFSLTVIYVN